MLTRLGPLALAIGLSLGGVSSSAQEWHEAYREGLTALSRGDAEKAVLALRRAVALRPEPGRNVITYGTNVEPRYFPYLRLAEAHLALGQLEAAQQALEASARWGREPAEERQKLLGRLDAAADERRPRAPPATPTPASPTPSATPAPPAIVTPEPPVTVASAPPATTAPPRPEVRETTPSRSTSLPPPSAAIPMPSPPAAAEPATGALEVLSQPAGAAVYIDDEPVGSTDPETGRLVKTGLARGRHRVRVAHPGHDEVAREIDVPAGGRATFTAALGAVGSAPAGFAPLSLALVTMALVLVGVLAWMALRHGPQSPPPLWAPTPRAGRTDAPGPSSPGKVSPGARRDERGQEWFGDFRLLEMVGRGGMASVFKAERRNEVSALKRPLSFFLDDPQFLQRFLREAEIGRTLNHPNIVRILERGEVEGVPFFTMELVGGQPLDAFLRARGPVDPRTAASVVVQVAEALDFAHTKGVIHRDLKPSNIMLLPDGHVKVMDFGIARARRFDGLTATGAFLGTPEYVAPEMVEGRGTEARSDLYSLGVIFFELLTGQRPFTGDTPFAVLRKHSMEEAPLPSHLEHGVPPELDAIVRHLLRKDPAERPASAEELVVTLRDWLNRTA
jgi:Protein kinase domain/PEGA domain